MVDEEVMRFIRNSFTQGLTPSQIRNQLMRNGISRIDADQAIAALQVPEPESSAVEKISSNSSVLIMIITILAFLVAGVGIVLLLLRG